MKSSHVPTRQLPARLLAAALALSSGAAMADGSVTLYGGVRGGGEFSDATDSSRTYALDSGGTVAASVDWTLADGRFGQVFYSFQRSALPRAAGGAELQVNVSYLHAGGRVYFDGSPAHGGGYVVGGLGITHLSPGQGGLSAEVRPSINLGVGYEWPVAKRIALRGELRGYMTLLNSSGGFFCSGGCVVSISGDTLAQAEALVGLSFGF